jgi:hypothetical protein
MRVQISREMQSYLLILCLIGFSTYGILHVLAMIFYPGGTSSNAEKTGYSFLENFFSDLGIVRTYSGEPNTSSSLLFTISLLLVGLVLIVFFLLFFAYFEEPSLGKNLSRAGTVAGVVSGISCIGIALTPWDRFLEAHMIFGYCLSFSFLAVALLYSAAIFRNPMYPNVYAILFIAYFAILLLFVALIIFGRDIESIMGIRLLATGQKICIYSGMICMFIQVIGAYVFNQNLIGEKAA